jgi:nanoRNase/pAp phosphatase (c-di-AMP/oligoRNAs hydrolase)
MDKIVEQNPTIFDGLHLINIDYHRINEQFGSVNYVDQNASSVCEMLVSLFESLEQGIIDESIATALYTGITSATHNFTIPDTTAKSMTVAAQMLAAGAKQQEVVKVMNSKNSNNHEPKAKKEEVKVPDVTAPTSIKEAMEQAKKEASTDKSEEKDEVKKESKNDGSKKNNKSGIKDSSKQKASSQDHSKDESAPKQPKSPLEK